MDYKIPYGIKVLCEQDNLKDSKEQELVKRELVKFLIAYLTLGDENDNTIGRNSLANLTDIVSKGGEFPVKGTVYPFERDVAGRMVRTRNYTMKEGVNKSGQNEIYVIAADRDWWDKYSGWVSIGLLISGFILGILGEAIKNRIFSTQEKYKSSQDTISLKVLQLPQQTKSTYNIAPVPSNAEKPIICD